MKVEKLVEYLDQLLEPHKFEDHCPNGLQVEGRKDIQKIVTGVSACQALLDAAIEVQADTVLVHHGYFWDRDDPRIVGVKRNRIKTLLDHNINLFAYHLCLDAQPVYGNNMQLAKLLDLQTETMRDDFLYIGKPKQAITCEQFSAQIKKKLGQKPFFILGQKQIIKKIAWCSGAAQDLIEQAANSGCDTFLTGEVSERTVHLARELGINFFAAGHNATERYGIQALGEHLAQKFHLVHQFIEIENPV